MRRGMRLFSFLLAAGIFLWVSGPAARAAGNGAIERIQKNKEINCGVYVLGSIFSYGPDGRPQGFTVDLMNEIGARTDLSVRYTEISSFATLFEDMKAGHFDMVCSPLLMIPAMTMKALPGDFLKDDPVNIYADAKADLSGIADLKQLNDPKYRFVGMDGELGGLYVPKLFPKATLNLLPMGTSPANMFLELFSGKADFIILSRLAERAYSKENPGKIRQVTGHSLLTPSVRLFFPEGAEVLKANIDAIVDDMRHGGTLGEMFRKNGLEEEVRQ